VKKSENKPELGLVYKSTLEAIARVRRFGIDKHGNSEDWRTTPECMHHDAMLRHLFAYIEGEEFDAQSGLPHLAHLLATASFEYERNYGGIHTNIVRHKSVSDSLHL
jgi:hypothetical protein